MEKATNLPSQIQLEPENTFPGRQRIQSKTLTVLAGGILLLVGGSVGYYFGTQQTPQAPAPLVQTTSTPLPTPTLQPELKPEDCDLQGELTITPSKQKGKCELSFLQIAYKVSGYSFSYPATWTVNVVGAERINLLFNEGQSKKELFVQALLSTVSLEKADAAEYSFEYSAPDPIVDPNEKVINKEIKNIGNKKVLSLVTTLDEKTIQRYFLVKNEKEGQTSVYMFKMNEKSDTPINPPT